MRDSPIIATRELSQHDCVTPPSAPNLQSLRRHHLLWIDPRYRRRVAAQVRDSAVRRLVIEHMDAGAPLVMRCQANNATSTSRPNRTLASQSDAVTFVPRSLAGIFAGLPLPPADGKLRLAFELPREWIIRIAPPLELAGAVERLPWSWQALLRELLHSAGDADLSFRVFGSVAWQALTGRPYLTVNSDVDLMWQPRDAIQIAAGIAVLETWQARTGLTADAEIWFGDDAAVSWREWRGNATSHASRAATYPQSSRVLAKTLRGPRLCSRNELYLRAAFIAESKTQYADWFLM